MLDQRHLGDEVGGGDKFRLGVAAGDDDVQVGPACGERSDDGGKVEIKESGGNTITMDSNGIELKAGGQKVLIGSSSVKINDGALEIT